MMVVLRALQSFYLYHEKVTFAHAVPSAQDAACSPSTLTSQVNFLLSSLFKQDFL